jgi:predicted transport protein
VYDFIVEVIPRRHRLTLLINLAFEDCDDPTGKATDATQSAFIVNATEKGGVLYTIQHDADIPAAINIARQAYESIAE